MFDLIVNVGLVGPQDEVTLECEAADKEELFVEWLNALLAQADIHEMAFSQFAIKGMNDHWLRGVARGEKLDQRKHQPKLEVKAATYSMLSVENDGDRWSVKCVVDV